MKSFNPFFSYLRHRTVVHSTGHNLGSIYDTYIIHSPVFTILKPMLTFFQRLISEFATHASFGGEGGSHIDFTTMSIDMYACRYFCIH